ncbi:proteasomal ubiquitin receptor ADRM1 homolog isoform X2 [Dendroctonus ponderosae]|uniref:Proteasomal ubiquitin receptor ADRM1 homolog n=1 Tax=Dendroctonus ponderosae TaxID=77166 RepID=J3JZ23_DENPD|nr:proteasomal ubiquitin receptor ADRM1 homolog isoform X2 [Dendroctonus ponderosae]AEE63461.1 unknown [Dendroctonus ponderosae]
MPAGGALFGSGAAGPGSTGGNKHLIEVKAGKMFMKGVMVHPEKRKGLIYIYQSEESLMHFCWQDRTTGTVEDDLIIFPDDCEYVKVPQCTTGRVYLLKFKSSNRRFFFWLQDSKTDKDEDNCKRINELLNNPSSAVQSSLERPDQDLQALLSSMSQSQLMQLFGGAGQMSGLSSLLGTMRHVGCNRSNNPPAITHRTIAATPTTTTTTTTSQNVSSSPATPTNAAIPVSTPAAPRPPRSGAGANEIDRIRLADLQNFLQEIAPMPASQPAAEQQSGTALSSIVDNPDALQQLQDHLPPIGTASQEALKTTLSSPHFQQAVSQFSSALESGQLGPVVSQLAVNPEAVAAAASGNMQEFVKALEKADAKEKAESKDESKKKDDDDEMQLD